MAWTPEAPLARARRTDRRRGAAGSVTEKEEWNWSMLWQGTALKETPSRMVPMMTVVLDGTDLM